jgi:hypothetical protein
MYKTFFPKDNSPFFLTSIAFEVDTVRGYVDRTAVVIVKQKQLKIDTFGQTIFSYTFLQIISE